MRLEAELGAVAAWAAFAVIGRLVRRLEKVVRALARVETWNRRVAAKRAMLRDGRARARVLRELGGLPALAAWERRARRRTGARVKTRSLSVPLKDRVATPVPSGEGVNRTPGHPAPNARLRFALPELRGRRPRVAPRTNRSPFPRALAPDWRARPVRVWPVEFREARAAGLRALAGHPLGRPRRLPTDGEFGASVGKALRLAGRELARASP